MAMDTRDYQWLLEQMRVFIRITGDDEAAFKHILQGARLLMDEYEIDHDSEDAAASFEPLENAIACLG